MIAAAILPTFCSGALWSVGQLGWLVANTTVGEEVSFPVLTSGPAVVGCLWGILLFKEVRVRFERVCLKSNPGYHARIKDFVNFV